MSAFPDDANADEAGFTAWWSSEARRMIYDPNDAMREIHRSFARWLENRHALGVMRNHTWPLPYAHGISGRSSLSNARAHSTSRYFYVTDLVDAFGSVRAYHVAVVLIRLIPEFEIDDTQRLVNYLERYFFLPGGGLYTGGPASPFIFNLYASAVLDEPLAAYCSKHNLKYSRYMDDVTISSSESGFGSSKRKQIAHLIRKAGFELHPSKTHPNHDLLKSPLTVAGVQIVWMGVGEQARLIAPPRQRRRAETVLGLALDGSVSRFRGHGHAGAVLAVTGDRTHSTDPSVTRIQTAQNALKRQHRLM